MLQTEVVLQRCSPTEKHLRFSRQDKKYLQQQAKETNRPVTGVLLLIAVTVVRGFYVAASRAMRELLAVISL